MKKIALIILLVLGLLGYAQAATIGYWKFEEGSGTSVSDETGNFNVGTAPGNLFVAGGVDNNPSYGGNYSIQGGPTGGSNYVDTNTNLNTGLPAGLQWPDWGTSFTTEFSIYYGGAGTSADSPLFGSWRGDRNEFWAYIQADGQLYQKVLGWDGAKTNHYLQVGFNQAIAAGDARVGWNDIAFELDGAADAPTTKIYLNQKDISSESYVWRWNQQGNVITSGHLSNTPMDANFFIGGVNVLEGGTSRIDELRISSGLVPEAALLMNIPEPATLGLLVLASLGLLRRRR